MDYSFGTWVKRRRKALDLTQQELAQRVGCSLATIVKIEADQRRPSHQIAELLAEHLVIPTDQRDLFLKIARQVKGIANLDTLPPLSTHPPLSQIDPPKYNIPVSPSPLIGREHEITMILQQLHNPACRLLTLTGPGGVGKTRLALEVAHTLRDHFPQGVFFVPLAGVTAPEFFLPAISESIGLTFSAADHPRNLLFSYLKDKYILLVLDNLEHLLDGVEILSELLLYASHLKILATSREQLNLRIEWVITVQGLPIPSSIRMENVASNSAMTLFTQRARQVKFDFALREADLPHVQRICQLVEGLPLGLEIAATWVRTLSCREIAREIENNIDFLTVSSRDVQPRHRSMRAVFDYSWTLLSFEEQQTLMKLSVFQGGFTREAASQVAGATLPLLSSLVGKSLVWQDVSQRYELHELVHQYAGEQLDRSGGQQATRDRHFEYFLSLAESSRTKLRSSSQMEWLSRLEQDHDNLRTALEWSLRFEKSNGEATPDRERGIQSSFKLTGALYLFWRLHNHWSEGRQWLQRALDQPTGQKVSRARARALNAAVLLSAEVADLRKARQLADQNLALARELGGSHILARAHQARGTVLWKQKDFAAAHADCEQAIILFRELGNRPAVAGCLQTMGRIAMNQNRLEAAHTYLIECVEIFQECSNTIELHAALSDLGLLAYLREDFSYARSCHEKSLAHFREAGNIAGLEMSLNRLGDIARCENNYKEAERLYMESLFIYHQTGDKDEIASLLHNLGYIAIHHGDGSDALDLFREALAMQIELDNQGGVAECLAGIAGVFVMQGQWERAATLFAAAEALREAAGVVPWPANRLEYERSLWLLRERMDKERFLESWSRGRKLSAGQAIEEATG